MLCKSRCQISLWCVSLVCKMNTVLYHTTDIIMQSKIGQVRWQNLLRNIKRGFWTRTLLTKMSACQKCHFNKQISLKQGSSSRPNDGGTWCHKSITEDITWCHERGIFFYVWWINIPRHCGKFIWPKYAQSYMRGQISSGQVTPASIE